MIRHMRRPSQFWKLTQVSKAKTEQKETVGGFLSTFFWALVIAFGLRTFIFQPFTIPSASMEPNLIEGDYIITSKYSVGYGRYAADPLPFPVKSGRLFERMPKRGDVIVFKPEGRKEHFIKRMIGLPGDKVQLVDGVLQINGTAIPQKVTKRIGPQDAKYSGAEILVETPMNNEDYLIFDHIKNNPSDNSSVFTVPVGYYFMMGDNRDHSGDSRMTAAQGGIGFVPAENLIGRAEFILLSAKDDFSLFKPWTWNRIRGDRFFVGLR